MSFPERAEIVLEAEEEQKRRWACEESNNFTGECQNSVIFILEVNEGKAHIIVTQVQLSTFCNSLIPTFACQTAKILKGVLPSG